MVTMTFQEALELGLQNHRAGRLSDAEAIYRQILAADPRQASALHLLGVIAHQVGQSDTALKLIKQAIGLDPTCCDAYNSLGTILREKGQFEEAISVFRQVIVLEPNNSEAGRNLNHAFGGDKARGLLFWDALALDRNVSASARKVGRYHLYSYAPALEELAPSFRSRRIDFAPPAGYYPGAPSIARYGNDLYVMHRMVNYTIPDHDHEIIVAVNGGPIQSRNFLLWLDDELNVTASKEILQPAAMPVCDRINGFEDSALFEWNGGLWTVSMVMSPAGLCQQVLLLIDRETGRVPSWRILASPFPNRHDKNWMPLVEGERASFVYLCDPTHLIGEDGTNSIEQPEIAAEHFRGGSQLVPFAGGLLAIIHEVAPHPERLWRFYSHRFVWFERSGAKEIPGLRLSRISRPFYLHRKHVEYVRGMVWHQERLVMSFHVDDRETYFGVVEPEEVRALLFPAENSVG